MNDKNNILLISDDEKLSIELHEKLVFMRKNDNVIVSNYEHARRNIQFYLPEIILVHEASDKNKTIKLISDIMKNDESSSVILLVDNYDSDFILNAYEAGIADFTDVAAADFEIVIRTVNNLKNVSVKYKATRNFRLLVQAGIIDELTGFYSFNAAQRVIENEINYNLLDNGVFMVVEPDEDSKQQFSMEKFAKAVNKSLRAYDLVTMAKGAKLYILLPKTDVDDAIVVLDKIKANYGKNFKLKAGLTNFYKKSFEKIEHEVLHALSEAVYSEEDYVVAQSYKKQDTLDEWLQIGDDSNKDYKLFRQMFNKKMEKVITPVFYRLQKAYEEKLFGTKIEQYTDEEQCVFTLKNRKQESSLRIVYPGFAKIIIYITHKGLESPEDSELSLPLTKITSKELIKIIEDFIKEFKNTSID